MLLLFLVWPERIWTVLARGPRSPADLLLRVAVPFSLGIAAAVWIGQHWFDESWSAAWGYNPRPLFGEAVPVLAFVTSMSSPIILAALITWLAPWCGARRDFRSSLNVAVFAALPMWLASLSLVFLAGILLCLVAFVWTCVLLAQGTRVLLGSDRDDSAELVMGAMLGFTAVLTFGGILVAALPL